MFVSRLGRIAKLPVRGVFGGATLLLLFLIALPSSALGQDVRSRLEAARQRRLDVSRFPHEGKLDGYILRAAFTGRTMLAPERSVFVRNHLLVEVLLTPPPDKLDRVALSAFALRINEQSYPRLAQAPGVAAYFVRNPEIHQERRLEAGAQAGGGRIVWDSGGRSRRPRIPGDRRVPPRTPSGDRESTRELDAAELDAAAVQENAFPEGLIRDTVAGYLYFPAELDLDKIRKLELQFQPGGPDGPTATLRLK